MAQSTLIRVQSGANRVAILMSDFNGAASADTRRIDRKGTSKLTCCTFACCHF